MKFVPSLIEAQKRMHFFFHFPSFTPRFFSMRVVRRSGFFRNFQLTPPVEDLFFSCELSSAALPRDAPSTSPATPSTLSAVVLPFPPNLAPPLLFSDYRAF